jgi:hypothetical protein
MKLKVGDDSLPARDEDAARRNRDHRHRRGRLWRGYWASGINNRSKESKVLRGIIRIL